MSEELKKDNFLKVFEMAQANVPIIEENLIINTRTPWVYYGPNNLAPQELIRLYNSSPTHRAAIMSKWFGVRGESISLKNGDDQRLLMANSIGESVYDIWQKATLDFILYGAVSLNIVWRKDRDQGFEIYYTDTSKLRAGRTDMHDRINDYYFSADWAFPKKEPFVPRRLPAFNITSEEPSQIYYYTTHSVGNNYYATPTYWGAATAISTELEIYNWWFNSICNNLQPSLFVSINSGIPDPEQREDIYRTLTQKYGGSNSTSKLMLTFANSKEEAPEITQIATNGSDKMWIEMGASVQQAILTAHQVSSAELLGISTPGALGSRDHLEAQDHYNRLVISPTQVEIKKIFEKLLTLRDGIPAEIEIKQFKMVSLPDEAPIETINVDKTEGLDINKNETIN
jgi:hypothetical protein